MNTGERPVAASKESLPSLMQETYKLCREYVQGKAVLDIGCGEGVVDLFLNDIARSVTGVDVDKKTVETANRRFSATNMRFFAMSGEHLDFPDQSFDVIISAQSIEHMQNDRAFLEGVRRILKNGGVFICSTPNKLACVPPVEKPHDGPYYPFHVREYTPGAFFGLLGEYFRIDRKICYFNPDKSLKFLNSWVGRAVYHFSRNSIIRWLARTIPLKIKEKVLLAGFKDKTIFEDRGTDTCEYHESLGFDPGVICAVCNKP